MSYQVLARKWRPKHFQDMVGQEAILRMLSNALLQKRLHHAYLLTGTRGVGKTTLGRILAKCLNCVTDVTPTPCGQCDACRAIDAGQFLDLFEIDAASRTKVEDTRDLLENVLYAPTQGRYKIYLIDEVHMLSNHSFNALLKTLEEPPEHVKFILATTDPKKIPITILSRCLQFHLKQINHEQIAKHLTHICATEQIKQETSALEKIAKAAQGSMRDALSLLDQAIAYGQGSVTTKDVNAMLGSMPHEILIPLLVAIFEKEGPLLFNLCQQLAANAPDYNFVLEEMIHLLHQTAIIQIIPDAYPVEPDIQSLAAKVSPEDIQLFYQIALLGRRDLAYAPSPQQGFEMTLLRMLAFKPAAANPTRTVSKPPTENIIPLPKSEEVAMPATSTSEIQLSEWRDILPKLELSGMAYALASNCSLSNMTDQKVELALSKNHEPMLNPKLKERMESALERYFKKPMQLVINITADTIFTPMKQQQQEDKAKQKAVEQTVLENPKIKQLIEMYDATVEVSLMT